MGGFEVASKIVFGIVRMIMWTAPLGAFGGMAFTVSNFGGGALQNLALLLVTFWGTAAVFVFVVLGLVARLNGFSILKLIRMIKDELLIILGTSSSETVLPRLLVKLERAGRLAAQRRRRAADGLLVQPRRHLHLPDARARCSSCRRPGRTWRSASSSPWRRSWSSPRRALPASRAPGSSR